MAYNLVQTFFVGSDAVNGSSQVYISGVDLYFKKKPKRDSNKSGLSNPSVSVQICAADRDKPNVEGMASAPRARVHWDDIVASSDGSVATRFQFKTPMAVASDKYYGIYIQVSDQDYELWKVVQGHRLVNTNTPTSGPAGKYDGYLFEGASDTTFRAKSDTDLKFGVMLARYAANTAATRKLVLENYEFVTTSSVNGQFLLRERVFQDASDPTLAVPVYGNLPGTLNINALSREIVGVGTSFANIANGQFVVLGKDLVGSEYHVAKVSHAVNNSVLVLAEDPKFTSNTGTYRLSPVADMYDPLPYFDRTNDMVLYKSTANATHRFVGGGLRGVTVANTGAGYSNTNIVRVPNPGGTDATFAITTNGAGAIASLRVLNSGAGFTAPANARIETSISDTTLKSGSPGANASITVAPSQIGLTLRGHISGAQANLVSVDRKNVSEVVPVLQEINSAEGAIAASHSYSSGTIGATNANSREARLGVLNRLHDYPAFIASKSLEVSANNGPSAYLDVQIGVNKSSDFLFETPQIEVERSTMVIYENEINNDATGEETNNGNALAKYIGNRISFDRPEATEDLIVYVRASRPAGTDVKVYAKLHNSVDDEAFDDKLWTELSKLTPDVFTPAGSAETTTIQYAIPQFPPSELTISGVVSTSNNSTTVTGTGTNFANTMIGRLVKIYSPISPQNHQVASVTAVANATSLTLGSPVSNNSVQESVVGSGLKMDVLKNVGTAFRNILNDNVARYHTISNQAEIDSFDTFAIKIVLLSDNKYIVPEVDDISMMGVSA